MARSIRSKSIRKNKQIKRDNIFAPVEARRIERLATKQEEIVENDMKVERIEEVETTIKDVEMRSYPKNAKKKIKNRKKRKCSTTFF
jgi:hypothetical protein